MTDTDESGRAAWEKAQGEISAGSLDFYRERLADPSFQKDFPEHWAALKNSVDKALSASQQSLDVPADGRSAAASEHDRRYGVTMVSGVPQLPSDLSNAVTREATYDPSDPHEIAAQLSNIGRSYKDDYAAAARLLNHVGSKADASRLTAQTLANLAILSDHIGRWSKGRPQ
jgi:hypothetical protein